VNVSPCSHNVPPCQKNLLASPTEKYHDILTWISKWEYTNDIFVQPSTISKCKQSIRMNRLLHISIKPGLHELGGQSFIITIDDDPHYRRYSPPNSALEGNSTYNRPLRKSSNIVGHQNPAPQPQFFVPSAIFKQQRQQPHIGPVEPTDQQAFVRQYNELLRPLPRVQSNILPHLRSQHVQLWSRPFNRICLVLFVRCDAGVCLCGQIEGRREGCGTPAQ